MCYLAVGTCHRPRCDDETFFPASRRDSRKTRPGYEVASSPRLPSGWSVHSRRGVDASLVTPPNARQTITALDKLATLTIGNAGRSANPAVETLL
mmetsp:Transcript_3375/g.10437  ORF Transcript_3375/g.10437 Transcript_3375/m.10437 type:complete len:95 (+) Transcript_3375:102-386(+)